MNTKIKLDKHWKRDENRFLCPFCGNDCLWYDTSAIMIDEANYFCKDCQEGFLFLHSDLDLIKRWQEEANK